MHSAPRAPFPVRLARCGAGRCFSCSALVVVLVLLAGWRAGWPLGQSVRSSLRLFVVRLSVRRPFASSDAQVFGFFL